MKKFKVSLAVVALVLGVIGASAFRTSLDSEVWRYDGDGDATDPSNYEKVEVSPTCSELKDVVCFIIAEPQAAPNDHLPNITSALATEIQTAESSNIESSNVKLTVLP